VPHFRPGDVVDHIDGWEGVGRHELPVIERVNSTEFPDDPVAFFVGGGFWRTSRLVVVERAAAYSNVVTHTPGDSKLSIVGPIGQSLDREQRVIQLTNADGSVEIGLGDFSGLIKFGAVAGNPPERVESDSSK